MLGSSTTGGSSSLRAFSTTRQQSTEVQKQSPEKKELNYKKLIREAIQQTQMLKKAINQTKSGKLGADHMKSRDMLQRRLNKLMIKLSGYREKERKGQQAHVGQAETGDQGKILVQNTKAMSHELDDILDLAIAEVERKATAVPATSLSDGKTSRGSEADSEFYFPPSSRPKLQKKFVSDSLSSNKRMLEIETKLDEMSTKDTEIDALAALDQLARAHESGNDSRAGYLTSKRPSKRRRMRLKKQDLDNQISNEDIDWNEWEVGGMGFLTSNDHGEVEAESSDHLLTSFTKDKRPSEPLGETKYSYQSITKRLYSTSSRPPLDPSLAPTTENSTTTSSSTQRTPSMPSLPHLTSTGSAHMVSVSFKSHTTRTAIAVGTVSFSNPTPLSLIQTNNLKKGDVLSVSRIAGIMAAKKCPDIIPLCHPIALTHVGVELKVFSPPPPQNNPSSSSSPPLSSPPTPQAKHAIGHFGGIHIESKVECTGPTGVEMEALTSVMATALSVVDMCKAVDKFQRIQDVRVVLKEGGKSGTWREEGWVSWQK